MVDVRLEVWDRLGTAGFGRKISVLPTITDSARLQPVNGIGEGRASLPDVFDRIPEILTVDPVNTANNVRSTVRVYLDGDDSGVDPPYAEWLPDQVIPPSESESGRFEISGLGREAMIRDAVVEPWDWDGSVDWLSTWPDWIYGGRDIVGPLETTFAPSISAVWIDAGATGTATIDIDIDGAGFQSATVAPGDSAFDVEQAIEALAYGITADVQGLGTITNPWQIRLESPTGTYTVAINSAGLTGGRIYTNLEQFGKFLPVGWTESRVGSTTIGHGILTDFRASLGGGGDPTLPVGCDAWAVFLGQEWYFPGVQTIRRVIPGGIYTLPPVWLYAQGANADVRVVVRDLNENLLAQEEISLVANTLTQTTGVWTGPAVVGGTGSLILIPEGVHEIAYRIGHIGTGTPPRIFVACPSMTEGFPASTIGVIVGDLYADWTTNHAASAFPLSYWVHGDGGFYLGLDFDGALDSAGNAWPRDESITIKRGERFDRVLVKIVGLGYEWRVVPGPVDGYYLLQIFTAPTLGTDYSALDTPTIRGGRDVTRRALRRWLAKTGALVEGADQFFSHAADAGARATWGVSSDYSVRLDFEPAPTAIAAIERVSDQLRKTRSLVVNIADIGQATIPIPGRTYLPGDTLRVLDPPTIVDDPERVWSILYSRDESGLNWEIQLGNQSFADTGGAGASGGAGAGKGGTSIPVAEGVRYLLEQQELVRAPMKEPLPTPITAGGGSMVTKVVAAANSNATSKERADFICTGVNDEATIQLAIQSIRGLSSNSNGRIWLTEGQFNIEVPAASFAIDIPVGIDLFGLGRWTSMLTSNASDPGVGSVVIRTNGANTVADFAIFTSHQIRGIEIDDVGDGVTIRNMAITTDDGAGVYIQGRVDQCWIQDNFVQGGINEAAIWAFGGPRDIIIAHNYIVNGLNNIRLEWDGSGPFAPGRMRIIGNQMVGSNEEAAYLSNLSGGFSLSHVTDNFIHVPGINLGSYGNQGAIYIEGTGAAAADEGGVLINDNIIEDATFLDGIRVFDHLNTVIVGNHIEDILGHGILLDQANHCLIEANLIQHCQTDNTFDAIHLVDADLNFITGNYIHNDPTASPNQARWRYGINVSNAGCNTNAYVGNAATSAGGFGTAAYNNAGTATQNTWPAAGGAQGDNFVL